MKNKVGTAILMSALGAMGSAASAYGQVAAVQQQQGNQQSPNIGPPQGEVESGWIITPSINVTETWTDDVNIDSSVPQSDFVTTTTLGLNAITNGPRFNLDLDYGLTHLFYPSLEGEERDEFRHNLQANSAAELIEDLFFLDTAAGVTQQFVDRRGAFSTVDVARSDNRATVSILSANPYILNRVGGNFATLRTGYLYNYVNTTNNITFDGINLGDNTSEFHEVATNLDSGTQFTRFIWGWEALYRFEKRDQFNNLNVYETSFTGDYQINRYIAAIGRIGWQKREGDDSQFNQFEGIIWNVGGRFTPGPKTVIQVTYGKEFFGNVWDASASYQITPNMLFTATFNEQYQTFAQNALDNAGGGGVIDDQFLITQDFARFRQYNASLTGVRGRSTITINMSRQETISENTITTYNRNSVGIVWDRQLNPKLTMSLSGTFFDDEFQNAPQSDVFVSGTIGFNYQLSNNLSANVEYIHSHREQQFFNFVPRKSNFISVGIGYVF